MLGHSPAQDRLEICQVGDVNDLIDTVHERAHRVVGRHTLAQQNNEMLAALCVGTTGQFGQNRIGLES